MKARYFTKDDLLQVQEIITSNTKMHGVDISKVTDKFVQMFATREPGKGSVCAFRTLSEPKVDSKCDM